MRILAVCGSLQSESSNLAFLRDVAADVARAAPEGVGVELFDGIRDLPLFDPDVEARGEAPEAVVAWRRALAGSDAVLIASPEYGHSLPGALKNAIDWVIGTGELEEKVVAITAVVAGPGRGERGLEALAVTLAAVRARLVTRTPVVRGEDARRRAGEVIGELVEAVAASRDQGAVQRSGDAVP